MTHYQQRSPEQWSYFPEQQNKSWGMVASAVISTGASAYGASKQRSAARRANEAAESARVDPQDVAQVAREQAARNIRDSLALEQQYTPENAALRQGAIRQLLAGLGQDSTGNEAIQTVRGQLGQTTDSQLFNDAVRMAGEDLALGGQLPQDVRNEVARNAISTSGRVGGGNLGLARFLAPRDLGISSMNIRENRLNRAGQLGQQETQNRMNATQLRSQLATLLANLGNNQFNQRLSTASFGQTLQPPVAGLDPGSIADLYTQNATNTAQAGMNAAQLQAQTGRNTAELYGGIGGLVSGVDWGSIFNRTGTTPASTGASSAAAAARAATSASRLGN